MSTKIVQVMHKNGLPAFDKPQRPHSTLFQVAEGPHSGTRGADSVLFDSVGHIVWDRDIVAVYETGDVLSREAFEQSTSHDPPAQDGSNLPRTFTDDEMHALVDANLYGYDGEHNAHATPNYRYCKPGTPGYSFDFDEGLWHREGAG